MLKILPALLLISIPAFSFEASTSARGGTYLTESSLLNALVNSPTNLYHKNKLIYEVTISAGASDSVIDLSEEDPKVDPGTYNQRITPYYGSGNVANVRGGVGVGYKGIYLFPKIYLIEGEALLNNPVYPEAKAQIFFHEGVGIGYATKVEHLLLGVSAISFKTKEQISTGTVLNYKEGFIETKERSSDYLYNLSTGYHRQYYKVVANYQHNTLYSTKDRFALGGELDFNPFIFYLDFQDIQNNNIENSTHIGITYKLSVLDFSLGLNQLYPTYGLGLNTKYFKLFYSYGGANQFEQFRRQYNQQNISIIFSNF